MAMCFIEKKDYDSAVKAVQKAMDIASDQARTGLYYQLGEIHEKGKDWQGALAAYSEVQSRDPSFEGINEILERVRSHTDQTIPEEEVELPVEGGMDDMLSDLIKEVEEMAKENSGEPGGEPGKGKKDRISYL
jgi:lipopolysaccharide biosynthesis regulator YciM